MKVLYQHNTDAGARYRLLADSSILLPGRPFFMPEWASFISVTPVIALRVDRLGKHIAPRFAHRDWQHLAPAFISTGLDTQGQPVEQGALSEAFDGALMLGEWVKKEQIASEATLVTTCKNSSWLCENVSHTLAQADDMVAHISRHMTLKMGDVLCVGLRSSRLISVGDTVTAALGNHQTLTINIK